MTPEAQRIAIAKACGWQHCTVNHHSTGMFLKGTLIGTSPDSERTQTVPDYLNDLNAMHEAWMTLDRKQRVAFSRELRQVVVLHGGVASCFNEDIVALCENATAAQRAEAFLRTMGLWEEGGEK